MQLPDLSKGDLFQETRLSDREMLFEALEAPRRILEPARNGWELNARQVGAKNPIYTESNPCRFFTASDAGGYGLVIELIWKAK